MINIGILINLLHIGVIAPLILWVSYNQGMNIQPWMWQVLILLAIVAIVLHSYRLKQRIK